MPQFQKREYTLELITPAFLGGADQSAEWRTPALKALIRQWWRVVYVANHKSDTVDKMRFAEGVRFGSVDSSNNRKASIQIRFSEEAKATTAAVSGILRDQSQTLQYLGFGPFVQPNRPTSRTALNKGTKAKFKILIQGQDEAECQLFAQEIDETMYLINQFGTIGSRASNAWGSLHVSGDIKHQVLKNYTKNLELCLKNNWKQAISVDQKGIMIWQTRSLKDTDAAMIALKTFRKEDQNTLAKQYGQRALINGPFNNQNRWPNQYILKVIKDDTGFRGQVTLLAHQWPSKESAQLSQLLNSVATKLDNSNLFQRMITA